MGQHELNQESCPRGGALDDFVRWEVSPGVGVFVQIRQQDLSNPHLVPGVNIDFCIKLSLTSAITFIDLFQRQTSSREGLL